jgi:hypothetical protein
MITDVLLLIKVNTIKDDLQEQLKSLESGEVCVARHSYVSSHNLHFHWKHSLNCVLA